MNNSQNNMFSFTYTNFNIIIFQDAYIFVAEFSGCELRWDGCFEQHQPVSTLYNLQMPDEN